MPIIPVTLFIIAVSVYSLAARKRKTLYATIIIMLMNCGYTGFWFYTYKMPLSSLEVTMMPIEIQTPPVRELFLGNQFDISFNLTIRNPTDVGTPPFMIENLAFYIDNVKLETGTYAMWGWGRGGSLGRQGRWYFDTHMIVMAHQFLIADKYFAISIYSNATETEEGPFENVWNSIVNKDVTLSLSGFFTSRPNFTPGDYSYQSMIVLASSQFWASCSYT